MLQRIFTLLMATLLIVACSKQKTVRLSDKNFKDEVPLKGMLSFSFSKDIVPDSLVGQWTEQEYIGIEPSVIGKYHWAATNKLVFIPADGFKPATTYLARFSNDIFKYTKYKYKGDKEFEFHTPYLELISSRAYWDKATDNDEHLIKVDFEFNYPVLPSEVEKLLEVKVNKEIQSFNILTDEISDKVSVAISGLEKEDQDYPVDIQLVKGLNTASGGEPTSEPIVQQFDIPSPFKLNITDFDAHHDGNEGIITLYTTQEVKAEHIKSYISIDPKIKYKVDIQPGYFIIKSEDFGVDSKYNITIKKGLSGILEGKLKYDFEQPVSFGKIKPTIKFYDQKEYYLSSEGSRNIQAAIINVPKVKVKIWKIYENNIIKYLGSNRYYYYDYDYYDYDYYKYNYSYNYGSPGKLGDVIYEKTIETNTLPRKGSNRLLTLDFEDKLKNFNGIYVIEVQSDENYYPRASKMVSISDIGLIVKKGQHNITVFANSIKSVKPLSDVTINFIGANNQLTYTTKTNADGVAKYEYANQEFSGFDPVMVTAQLNSDYNVLHLQRTKVNTSRFDVGGLRQNPSGLEAFIYGDRNLYRPGESVKLSAIIRDYNWKSPGDLPIIIRINTPTGKNFKTIKKVLNKYGSFELEIPLLSSAQTGSYHVGVYTSNEVLIGTSTLKIEEFMPDRMKVEVELDKESYKPGEVVKLDLQADNFFGPPAANRNYEVEMSTVRKGFYPKKNRDYIYYIEGANDYFSKKYRERKTGPDGHAQETFSIPREYRDMGILRSDVFVTVFDETGRPVNRLKKYNIYTQDVFYGIKQDDYYVKIGQPIQFGLIAIDKNGNALKNIDAEVSLIRIEYKTVLSKSGGYFRYKSERVENVLEKKIMKINETSTTFGYIPELSGNYELRIRKPGVSTYVYKRVYAYGWGRTTFSSFKVNNEGQIDIETDKEKYKVGDKAKILLKAPFTGKILVTVETDKVLDYFYLETDKRAASFELDIKKEHLPNIYISAILFRPHSETDIPLTVAYGFAPLKVDNPNYKMPIDITAVEKSRSNTKQRIKVKGQPNSALTIAVVDEGILQVAGYSTPDPYGYYYQRRALQVNTSNIYPYLFPEISSIKSHTGGGAGEMEKRLNPLQSKRVKLVSFWSGILETNSKGEAVYEIDIPQFSGDLRIMAVGYNGQVFGSAHQHMKVADPLVVSVALPRFLSPGDKVNMPVVLTNTTEKSASCKASINLEGPLKIAGHKTESVSIPSNTEAEIVFRLEALEEIGQAKITVEVSALGEKFINLTDITVRPASPLQKRTGNGTIKAGQKTELNINVEDFIESSIAGKLIVSKNPMIQYTNSLDYLVRYPYGCVEQTVSGAFPQIYFGDLLGIAFSEKRAQKDAVNNVQLALDRIKLMQLYNGGLTYWPGHGTETWWGSVFSAHFTLEAKKAGYQVDESFLNLLLKYLKKRLQKKETITYYYNNTLRKKIAPKEVAYSLYVLTMGGEKPRALMNYYRTRTEILSLDSKYLLAAAYVLIGDEDNARQVLPKAFTGEKANTSFGGSFYSYIRDEAIALNVLLEIDPDNPQVGLMAKHISEALLNRRYLNTQERCFGFIAMGKIARIAAGSDIKGKVSMGNKVLGSFDNRNLSLRLNKDQYKNISINTQGNGQLYYYWESEGISADGSYLEEDSYIEIRRSFYNRNGQWITDNRFKQNDLVLVQLRVRGLTDRYIDNVAISDILPACFEIENPRLTILPPGLKYPHKKSVPEYLDIRDDRVNMFTRVSRYESYYYYLVRVVSSGTYNMGPVSADAMYNGEYHSYNGGGIIKVDRE